MTIETQKHTREKCRFCKVYLAKGCLNDICLECSKLRRFSKTKGKAWF